MLSYCVVVDLNFCLKTLEVKNRSKLKKKKEKQDALVSIIEHRNVFRPGNREEARINIHYFLTRNSPKDINSLCTDQFANFSSGAFLKLIASQISRMILIA